MISRVKRRRFTVEEYHPVAADVLLLVEVADSSLLLDRRVKIPLYARAGVPEVWYLASPANTTEIILIHHTRCGMLAFTDDLLKAGLEDDPAAEKLLGQATGRAFISCKRSAATPSSFHAFRGQIEAPRDAKQTERLAWDVRRGCPRF